MKNRGDLLALIALSDFTVQCDQKMGLRCKFVDQPEGEWDKKPDTFEAQLQATSLSALLHLTLCG